MSIIKPNSKAVCDLSIIIVAYKSKERISQCIRSVLEATQGLSSEIIIVNNSPGDGLSDTLNGQFPEVKVIENKKNEGFARGINQGARMASGRYLNILNPDTLLHPDSLKIMLNFMEKNPECCLVGSRAVDETEKSIPSCRSLPHILNIIKYPLLLFLQGRRLTNPNRFLLDIWEQNKTIDVTKYNGYLTGACIITPLDFFKKMGMFDERYFLYCEDIDFGFRLKQMGFHGFLVPEASMIHLSGHSASQNPMSQLYFVNAYIHYIQKNFTFLHGMFYKGCFFLFVLTWVIVRLFKMNWKETPILLQALRYFVPFWLGGAPKLRDWD
jgi:GT2 family glycosyltransferase